MTKNIFLSLFIIFSFLLNLRAQTSASYYEIGEITITGAVETDEAAIIARSGLRVGTKIQIPGNHIPDAIKAIWRMKLFTDVQIHQKKINNDIVYLEIAVEEYFRLSRFTFSGIKNIHKDDLNEELNMIFVKGGVISLNDKAKAIDRIKSFYIDKGFLDTKIEVKEIPDGINSIQLVFNVTTGKKVKIQDISFTGNHQVRSKKLRKLMANTKLKKRIFASSKLIPNLFEEDKKIILEYYNSLGYRDAAIIKDSIWRAENGSINIHMNIDEGQIYYLGNISWRGNTIYHKSFLSKVLGIKKGDIYNKSLLESRLQFDMEGRDISSLYMDRGYLFFKIQVIEKAINDATIDVEIYIQEGPQATINEVSIQGNDRTSENVIRREIRTKPGDKFSRAAIIRSQRALINLGYFDPQNLSVTPNVNPKNGTVDIDYKVEERLSDKIELSAGWSGGIVGTLGLTFNNFSTKKLLKPKQWSPLPAGDGQALSFRIQASGKSYQSYNFSFSEPWLGGKKPNLLTLSGFYTNRFVSNDDTNINSKFNVVGGNIGLASRLNWPSDDFVSSTSLRFEKIRLSNWTTDDFILEDGSTISDGTFHNLFLSQHIERNTINNPIFPTSGSRLKLSFQLTAPYSLFRKQNPNQEIQDQFKWLEYHKTRFDFDYYKQLKGKLVLKASAKIGMIGRYSKSEVLSPFERFRFGGDALDIQQGYTGVDAITLRGYDEFDFAANPNGGATIFNKYSVELRYPLSLNPNATIFLLAFAEGGNAWKNINDFNPLDMKRSAGLGLRVHLPMFGTLGFDYGLGFDKEVDTGGNFLSKYGKFSIILGFEPD